MAQPDPEAIIRRGPGPIHGDTTLQELVDMLGAWANRCPPSSWPWDLVQALERIKESPKR